MSEYTINCFVLFFFVFNPVFIKMVIYPCLCLDGDLFYLMFFAELNGLAIYLFGSFGKLSCQKSFKFSVHHVLNMLSMGKTNSMIYETFPIDDERPLKQKHMFFGKIM